MSAPTISGLRWRARRAALWAGVLRAAMRRAGGVSAGLAAARALAAERDRWRGPSLPRKFVRGPDGRHFVSLHLPGFPSRAFDRLTEATLDRLEGAVRPALTTLVWAITSRCPLRCTHCSELELLAARDAVSDEGLLAILGALRARGVAQLQLSGGEPLQRLPMALRIAREVARDTEVWLLTSGVGLDAAAASGLREAGVTGVNVSLDHPDAAGHDRFRRRTGVHDAVVAGLSAARRAGLVTAVTLTLTRETADPVLLRRHLEEAAALGVGFVRWLEPRAVGAWAGEDVALSPSQREGLDAAYRTFNAGHPELPIVDYPGGDQRHAGCLGAGLSWAFVDARGMLHACPFCRDPVADVATGGLEPGLAALARRGCHLAGSAAARRTPALPVVTSPGTGTASSR